MNTADRVIKGLACGVELFGKNEVTDLINEHSKRLDIVVHNLSEKEALLRNADKIIEQLQAENERLKEQVKFLTKYDFDIDGLQAQLKTLCSEISKAVACIKYGDEPVYIANELLIKMRKDNHGYC